MGGRFFLHAVNVHCGGGLTLLQSVLSELPNQSCLLLDSRFPMSNNMLKRFEIYRIKATLFHRFQAERLLQKEVKDGDTVLCFGNLPPLFKLKARVSLFIQNRYLLESSNVISHMPFKVFLRLGLEKAWLHYCYKNVHQIIVQTPSMKSLALKKFASSVKVAPFVTERESAGSSFKHDALDGTYEFIYIASGDVHKNHKNLLDAWVCLAQEGFFPELCLTIDEYLFPSLIELIAKYTSQYGLRVDNLGVLTHGEVMELYRKSKVLIFPSLLESFGLPLLEAKAAGLKVVASELDYVRDLLDPDESFDPCSPVSIARAVKRLLNLECAQCELLSAKDFLSVVEEA